VALCAYKVLPSNVQERQVATPVSESLRNSLVIESEVGLGIHLPDWDSVLVEALSESPTWKVVRAVSRRSNTHATL
jgi:hypothetical protein